MPIKEGYQSGGDVVAKDSAVGSVAILLRRKGAEAHASGLVDEEQVRVLVPGERVVLQNPCARFIVRIREWTNLFAEHAEARRPTAGITVERERARLLAPRRRCTTATLKPQHDRRVWVRPSQNGCEDVEEPHAARGRVDGQCAGEDGRLWGAVARDVRYGVRVRAHHRDRLSSLIQAVTNLILVLRQVDLSQVQRAGYTHTQVCAFLPFPPVYPRLSLVARRPTH